MENQRDARISAPPAVRPVVDRLARLLNPKVIYLYNSRTDVQGEVTSFKLCVVADLPDRHEAEQRAYLEIDSDIPFDLMVYTPAEWGEITARRDSFAARIIQTGAVIYGKAL